MATVTIVFEDGDEDGVVNVSYVFDPPLDNTDDAEPMTPAQSYAFDVLKQVHEEND